jgi:hypothetical protein
MSESPYVLVRIPSEADFAEGDDFLDDELLDRLLLDVVGRYPALAHIEQHGISVRAVWKKKGGKSKGKLVYAGTTQPSGLFRHFCQFTMARPCDAPRAFRLTFRSRHGLTWIEAACRGHADPRTNQIREEGGQLVAVEELPPTPTHPRPMPIGLDGAAAAAEPSREDE